MYVSSDLARTDERIDASLLDDTTVHTPEGMSMVDVEQRERRRESRDSTHFDKVDGGMSKSSDLGCNIALSKTVKKSPSSSVQTRRMIEFQWFTWAKTMSKEVDQGASR